jgi:hypothetical protein
MPQGATGMRQQVSGAIHRPGEKVLMRWEELLCCSSCLCKRGPSPKAPLRFPPSFRASAAGEPTE